MQIDCLAQKTQHNVYSKAYMSDQRPLVFFFNFNTMEHREFDNERFYSIILFGIPAQMCFFSMLKGIFIMLSVKS